MRCRTDGCFGAGCSIIFSVGYTPKLLVACFDCGLHCAIQRFAAVTWLPLNIACLRRQYFALGAFTHAFQMVSERGVWGLRSGA